MNIDTGFLEDFAWEISCSDEPLLPYLWEYAAGVLSPEQANDVFSLYCDLLDVLDDLGARLDDICEKRDQLQSRGSAPARESEYGYPLLYPLISFSTAADRDDFAFCIGQSSRVMDTIEAVMYSGQILLQLCHKIYAAHLARSRVHRSGNLSRLANLLEYNMEIFARSYDDLLFPKLASTPFKAKTLDLV